jgi:SH3 domain-containing YSC84-like protein 1
MKGLSILTLTALAAGVVACGPRNDGEPPEAGAYEPPETGVAQQQVEPEQAAEARELAQDAANTLQKMQVDGELAAALDQAQGVFVVPRYGQAAAVVGVEGGEGVLLVSENGTWHGPAFYNLGGVSVGVQLGAEGGEIAMLLMSDEAVRSFHQEDNFSLSAEAGLTLIDWSERGGVREGMGDVILWSDTEGVFAGADLAVTDIHWDDDENAGFYGRQVSPGEVMMGGADSPGPNPLEDVLGRNN